MQRKKITEGKTVNGGNFKIAVVVSRFNDDITEKMLEGAQRALGANNVPRKNIKIVRVPGSFELPLACQRLALTGKYHGIIALGCVIKGETDHYYYVAGEASRGIMDVMLKYSVPIGFGLITADNLEQAKDRTNVGSNKGEEAVVAVLEMLAELD